MDQFTTDMMALDTSVKANTAAIQGLATLQAADKTTIASLNQQITDLRRPARVRLGVYAARSFTAEP